MTMDSMKNWNLEAINSSELKKITIKRLQAHSLHAKKRHAQHFVVDPNIFRTIINEAHISEQKVVLEVGGGLGIFSSFLAQRCKKLLIVEIDPDMAEIIEMEVLPEFDNIELIVGDVLEVDLDHPDVIVGNFPYKISGPLVARFVELENIVPVVGTFQAEFARRLSAQPKTKDYGRITVLVQNVMTVTIVKTFPAMSFYPPPKVASSVVRMTPKPEIPNQIYQPTYRALLTMLFNRNHKTISNNLKNGLKTNMKISDEFRNKIETFLKSNDEYLKKRPVELSPREFILLHEKILKRA